MNRSLGILLVVFLLLAGVAYLYWPSGEERETSYDVPVAAVSFDSAATVKIDIQRPGKVMTLENVGGKWMITSPGQHEANQASVTQLLSGLQQFKAGSLVSSNPEKQGLFQVDSAGTKLSVQDRSKKSTTLIIGKSGPSFSDFYFRMDGSNDVYVGEGLTVWSLNQEVKDWRDKSIYTMSSDSITQIEAIVGEKEYLLRKDSSSWSLNNEKIEDGEVTPALSTLSGLRAEDFVDTIPRLESRHLVLTIQGSAPGTLSFYPQQPDSSRYIVQTTRSSQLYVVGKFTVGQLLKPFEAKKK